MSATTLTVPAEHREAFRRAALYEVGFSGETVTSECESLSRRLTEGPNYSGDPLADLNDNADRLAADLALLAQIGEDGPAEVRAQTDVLLATAEQMARITGKQLAEGLDTAPVEPGDVKATRDSLDWSLAQVEQLGDRWSAEKEGAA